MGIAASTTTSARVSAEATLRQFRTWAIVELSDRSPTLKLPTSHLGEQGLCVVASSRPAPQDCKVVFELAARGKMERIELPARLTGHTFAGAHFRWTIRFTHPAWARAYLDPLLGR